MTLICLVTSPEWDFPVFKILPKNETSNGSSNQAGFVITVPLRRFFPELSSSTSAVAPTTDRRLIAELFVENTFLQTVDTRYQYQTRAGTRTPEPRLTDGLQPLIRLAKTGDILFIQRCLDRLDFYRLTLVRSSWPDFPKVKKLTDGRKWGALFRSMPPVSESDMRFALEEVNEREAAPFTLLDPSIGSITTTVKRVARSIVFRSRVVELYGQTCAICGLGLKTPSALFETEAAHVVPRSRMGVDDPRNGLALCRQHHWAFDKGLFGVDEDRRVIVPDVVLSFPQNSILASLQGRPIREASDEALRAHPDAFGWHRNNLLVC